MMGGAEKRNTTAGCGLPASLSWAKLVEIEPRLEDAEREIMAVADKGGESFCANAIWYGYQPHETQGFRDLVNQYTGWTAQAPKLRSEAAYDIAYEHLYDLLPPCRNCWCI